jgi:hypothetical protein
MKSCTKNIHDQDMVLKGKQFYIKHELCQFLSTELNPFVPDTLYYGEDIENAIVLYCETHDLWKDKTILSIHVNKELMDLFDLQCHIVFLTDLYHIARAFLTLH